jgi:Cu/Ag efflux pump CusA
MHGIPGVVDLQVEKQVLIDQVRIEVNREKAARYGLKPGALNEQLNAALQGATVAQVIEGQRTYDLVVRLGEERRQDVDAIRDLLIDSPVGGKVPLHLVADVRESKGPNAINRENVQRRIVVSANVSGRDLGSVVADIERTLDAQLHTGAGYFVSYEGQFESQQAATRVIGLLALFTFGAVFLLLYNHFRSGMIVAQVLLNIPLAFIGALVLTYFLVGTVSVATLVGLITLAGIASRNTIMMISHYLHLMQHEGEKFDERMIVRGSLERLVPVTMTAAVAGLALVPLVLAANQPGKEILYPVAVVILGGLVSSTFLDMAVTPAVFFKFGRRAAEQYLARAKSDPLDAMPSGSVPSSVPTR